MTLSPTIPEGLRHRLSRAITDMETALADDPDNADLHSNLGNLFRRAGRLPESLSHHRRAMALAPSSAAAYSNYAATLLASGDIDKAIEAFRQALALAPDHAELLFNLGTALQHAGRLEEAAEFYLRALSALPNHTRALTNLGSTLKSLGKIEQAKVHLERAVTQDPENAEAAWNLALALLLDGRYDLGWQHFEARRRIPDIRIRGFDVPEWTGLSLPNATLLLHAEQGLGDTLQFVRFAASARKRVGRVVFLCHSPLLPLLCNAPGIDEILPLDAQPPASTVQLPLMSLPRVLRHAPSSYGSVVPYLTPSSLPQTPIAECLATVPRPRIGICWQGNPSFKDDRRRSIPVHHFMGLADCGVSLVSLQKHHGLEQLCEADPDRTVLSLGPMLDNQSGAFVDTASVLKHIDLLITSDTAMPHLAGAMGVPVWCLLPYVPDWRWGLSGDVTPWYPTMRLFRQPSEGDWTSVFASVRKALVEFIRKNPRSL